MKLKNAIPSIICLVIFTALAAFTGTADPNDGTAAVIVSFFAIASAVNAADCLIHNAKVRKVRKEALHYHIRQLRDKSA